MSLPLRVRAPKTSTPISMTVGTDITWDQLVSELADKTKIPMEQVRVLTGFPPTAMDPENSTRVGALGLRPNDMLIVQEGAARVQEGNPTGNYVPFAADRSHLVRRICPGDNSCLFHACSYALQNKDRSGGPELRRRVVGMLLSMPETFNKESLGMDTMEYAAWIAGENTWGGGVELSIISLMFEAEIFALDLQSSTIQKFGTDSGYVKRAFLVYTGTHYDCIAMNRTYNSSHEKDDQTLFNTRDQKVLDRAIRFVEEEGLALKNGTKK